MNYENKNNLISNKLNINNPYKNINYKPKFIVIKHIKTKIKTRLGKKKRGRKSKAAKNIDKNNGSIKKKIN